MTRPCAPNPLLTSDRQRVRPAYDAKIECFLAQIQQAMRPNGTASYFYNTHDCPSAHPARGVRMNIAIPSKFEDPGVR